jgi:hypothetical protein
MRKIKISLFATSLVLCSCTNNNEIKQVEQKDYNLHLSSTNIKISEYSIDGCQYLGNLSGDHRNCYLSHKGNCTNPIHTIR